MCFCITTIKAKRRIRGNFLGTHVCMLFPVRSQLVFFMASLRREGAFLFRTSHPAGPSGSSSWCWRAFGWLWRSSYLFPGAPRKWPRVGNPFVLVVFCLLRPLELYFQIPQVQGILSLFSIEDTLCWEKSVVCVQRSVPGEFFRVSFNGSCGALTWEAV